MISKWLIAFSLFVTAAAHAQLLPAQPKHKHLGSKTQQFKAQNWNRNFSPLMSAIQGADAAWPVVRPFSEFETSGYVAISGEDAFELPQLREAIAQNLPDGVTLIVYVTDQSEVAALKADLGQYLDSTRLKFLLTTVASDGDVIWARDSLPFPVYLTPTQAGTNNFGLVASIYPQDFDPNAAVASALGLTEVNTNTYFRGGNMLLDLKGNCFSENVNEVGDMSDPQTFFTHYFGCSSVTLLNQEGGIGDIDERIKFLGGTDVLTDNDNYASLLQGKGYTVHRIPSTGQDGETYMNTLYVNGTIFVPQMNLPSDQSAIAAYQALGFKAVGVVTKQLADQGDGNIHCVTMNYPPGTFTTNLVNADFVQFQH